MKTQQKRTNTKKNNSAKNKVDMKEIFFNQILQKIEEVNADDWEHYIKIKFHLSPHNAFNNYYYKRFNRINLMLDILLKNRKSALYATFKQISERGGKLIKGSKGILVEFFSWSIKHIETKQHITVREYNNLDYLERKQYNVFPISKFYTVFNLEDVDVSNMNFTLEDQEPEEEPIIEINQDIEIFINKLIANKGLILQETFSGNASYNYATDLVNMPNKELCVSMDRYYSALFHELVHWTGNINRLNRIDSVKYGSPKYSFEELIAEMGSMLMCLDFNITSEFFNSLSYIKGWSRSLPENRETEFRKAFLEAQKAISFLTN